jgi:uncharacterized protein (DUF3084 family)
MFNQILVAAKVQTITDGGKNLVKKLNEFNGLDVAVVDLKQEKQSLVNETKDLNEKAELKGSLQADVTHLETQKKGLQAEVSRLQSIMQTTQFNVQFLKQDENGLLNNVSLLKETVSKNELIIKNQDKEIKTKQAKVADLTVIESKRADIVKEIADLDIKADSKKKHLMILESFEGYVQSTSLDQQEQFIATLPQLLKEVQQKNNSPELIRASIFQRLTGGTMRSLKCGSCNAEFAVDKPAVHSGYHCPACGISYSITEAKDEPAILKEFFTMTEPKINNPVIQVETKSSMKTALPPNTPEKSYFNVTNNGQWHQV